jgi:hypothetical protein
MLIATSLATAALLSASALAARPLVSSMRADVTVAPDIPPSLVTRVLEETSAIWAMAGVFVVWNRQTATVNEADYGQAAVTGRGPVALSWPPRLRVTIGDWRGITAADPHVKALGWIVFEAGAPQQEIYLSHANAVALFEGSPGMVGRTAAMTLAERETLLGRAMGRALAHEVGHYLLGSKAHTARGLMRAKITAAELFAGPRRGLQLAAEQKHLIAARTNTMPPIAHAVSTGSR